MSFPESGLWECWKNGVASQRVANGVNGAWMIFWSLQIHNDWELDGGSTNLILKQFLK